MGQRTGRKEVADKRVVAKAISIKKSNSNLTNADIARRLNVSPRQVQYWISNAKKRGEL